MVRDVGDKQYRRRPRRSHGHPAGRPDVPEGTFGEHVGLLAVALAAVIADSIVSGVSDFYAEVFHRTADASTSAVFAMARVAPVVATFGSLGCLCLLTLARIIGTVRFVYETIDREERPPSPHRKKRRH